MAAASKSQFDIRPYSGGTSKVNPYTEHVAALIAASGTFEDDEDPSIYITIPSEYTTAKGDVKDNTARTKRYFQEAAKVAGFSSRVIDEDDEGDQTTIGFVLTERVLRPRKPSTDDAAALDAAYEADAA